MIWQHYYASIIYFHITGDYIHLLQGSHSPAKPGKLLEFYVRPGIFSMISWFTLVWHCIGCIMYKLIRATKQWIVNVNDECLIFYIFWLRTMTESTWNILKFDWKTPGFFLFQKSGKPVLSQFGLFSLLIVTCNILWCYIIFSAQHTFVQLILSIVIQHKLPLLCSYHLWLTML